MQLAASAVLLLLLTTFGAFANKLWYKPGCHRVGHTREISIPGCRKFTVATHACRGFCESWTVPSRHGTLGPLHSITVRNQQLVSVGQCCNIMDTEDIEIPAACLDGQKIVTFKSATSCSCYHCKKE
ncbi:thyrostimulin alpha-2 subunit-like [Ctenocephalides felis]|uniref:thyrostimulin alpha-2 subunit-like n=1 Tax=Ctenocephalides felis TaxID=7515 RepID=UPI000E6E2E29|nr:thyrostimulin alpha-2 subunit-like [Ctenocephalides felis]XP_026464318.1 thyrostimulin alpha-2 subunit-like [Ctenocephalides felis]